MIADFGLARLLGKATPVLREAEWSNIVSQSCAT